MRIGFPILIALTLLLAIAAVPQTPKTHPHRVVFEVNSPSPAWDQVLGNIENMQKAFAPEPVQIEVVCFGKGLELLLKTDTAYEEHLKKVVDSGVSVMACQNSMRKRNVTTADLLPFAGQVDSGAAEVVRKQEAGWSYLKSGE
jgi:intracellular sulfur oxidation DsrE/DsrF family protein